MLYDYLYEVEQMIYEYQEKNSEMESVNDKRQLFMESKKEYEWN